MWSADKCTLAAGAELLLASDERDTPLVVELAPITQCLDAEIQEQAPR